MKKYELNFNEALRLTSELTNTPYAPIVASSKRVIQAGTGDLINLFISKYTPIEANLKCLAIHKQLKNYLVIHSSNLYFLTFGYVNTGKEDLFKFGVDEIKGWMSDPEPHCNKQYHCWLTLQSMEIIDISLPTTLMIHRGGPINQWRTVEDHPDELPSWVYYPVFVGEYLAKIAGMLV